MESPRSILLLTLPGWSALIENIRAKLGKNKLFGDEDPLIFYHIVKTAGSSFLHAFRLSYPEEAYYDSFAAPTPEDIFLNYHRFASLTEAERRNQKFIHLHVPAPLHQYIPGPSSYATILRNPTKLVLSFYFWQKSLQCRGLGNWARYTPDVPYEDLPLEDFLHKYEYIWANICCKQICNIERTGESAEDIARCVVSLADEDLYHRARETIGRHFSFVGVAERFSASLAVLHILRGHDRVYLWTAMQASGALALSDIHSRIIRYIRRCSRATSASMPGRRGRSTGPSAR